MEALNKLNFYERILDRIPAALVKNYSDGRMAWINKYGANLIGLDAEEFNNVNRIEYQKERYHPDDFDVFIESYYALNNPAKGKVMLVYREKDKEGNWMVNLGVGKVGSWNCKQEPIDCLVSIIDIANKFEELKMIDAILRENASLKRKLNIIKLTKREKQVFSMIANGKKSNEIAKKLNIKTETVKTHRKHIFEKLEAKNIADIVRIYTLCNIQNST